MAFARTENDWKLFNGIVEEKIHEQFEKGYKIVIFRCATATAALPRQLCSTFLGSLPLLGAVFS
jgi:hypothetical protein